jgi:hypothetical protein
MDLVLLGFETELLIFFVVEFLPQITTLLTDLGASQTEVQILKCNKSFFPNYFSHSLITYIVFPIQVLSSFFFHCSIVLHQSLTMKMRTLFFITILFLLHSSKRTCLRQLLNP